MRMLVTVPIYNGIDPLLGRLNCYLSANEGERYILTVEVPTSNSNDSLQVDLLENVLRT
jgi:hypothetical protein